MAFYDASRASYARIPIKYFQFLEHGLINCQELIVLELLINKARIVQGKAFRFSVYDVCEKTGLARTTVLKALDKIVSTVYGVSREKDHGRQFLYSVNLGEIDRKRDCAPFLNVILKHQYQQMVQAENNPVPGDGTGEYQEMVQVSTISQTSLFIYLINVLINSTTKLEEVIMTPPIGGDNLQVEELEPSGSLKGLTKAVSNVEPKGSTLVNEAMHLVEGMNLPKETRCMVLADAKTMLRDKKHPYTNDQLILLLKYPSRLSINFSALRSFRGLLKGDYSSIQERLELLRIEECEKYKQRQLQDKKHRESEIRASQELIRNKEFQSSHKAKEIFKNMKLCVGG